MANGQWLMAKSKKITIFAAAKQKKLWESF